MVLPPELQKLPPQAVDVIRYLGTEDDGGADVDTILDGTGLSERAFGKAIRRLVTNYYVQMPDTGYYVLTERGQLGAAELREIEGDQPAPAPSASAPDVFVPPEPPAPVSAPAPQAEAPAPPAPEPASAEPVPHTRRLSIFLPKELVAESATVLRMGFGASASGQAPLPQPGRVILRVSAPGCEVEPVERPLEVPVHAAAGPVVVRVTPHQPGTVRIRVVAYQLVGRDLRAAGGMYFDRTVAGFPTPGSVEFQTLGASVSLLPVES